MTIGWKKKRLIKAEKLQKMPKKVILKIHKGNELCKKTHKLF